MNLPRFAILNVADTEVPIAQAFANIAASTTDGVLVPAKSGHRIVVLSVHAHAGDTETSITFNSKPAGAGTAISSTKSLAAFGGYIRSGEGQALHITKVGEGLTITTGAGSTVGVDITYAYLRV